MISLDDSPVVARLPGSWLVMVTKSPDSDVFAETSQDRTELLPRPTAAVAPIGGRSQCGRTSRVDLDELRVAHASLGEVAGIYWQLQASLPRGGSPANGSGVAVPSAQRMVGVHEALLGRLAARRSRGVEAIEETRRRLSAIEAAYWAADRFG